MPNVMCGVVVGSVTESGESALMLVTPCGAAFASSTMRRGSWLVCDASLLSNVTFANSPLTSRVVIAMP